LQSFAPDAIYHLAAVSKASDCEDLAAAYQVNVLGTQHVLDLAASLPSRPRVVFVSSSYVYAAAPRDAASAIVSETAPLHAPLLSDAGGTSPSDGYAESKMAGEILVRQFVAAGRGAAVIARAFQHGGPRQSPRFMLAQWCEQFARHDGSPVTLQRDEATIDFADVRDVVRAYRLLAVRGAPGEAYNVGSGVAVRTGEIFNLLRVVADPSRPYRVLKTGTAYSPIADLTRLAAATGWRPEISLPRTVEETYRWYCGGGG
jgi:GDP-4-dehydro-6-deoxy-D-mannose reductase